ncbi:MAG: Chemotaxis protein CheA [candidate division WS2 bacterium]|nr:Chemotaxis protein CheA [Candidatus Lithacetigena glycinireducens]
MDYTALIKDYLDDANGHLNAFDESLMLLEKNGTDSDIILKTLGSLHTLKGNSGMMGFESLKIYIHQIEELFKKVNDNELKLSGVLDGLLDSANVIRNALRQIEENPSVNPDITESILSLQQLQEGSGNGQEKQSVELSSYLGTKTDTIRVDFKRLNDILNLVGELVIFKTRLNQIETQIREKINDKALSKELSEGLELMGKATAGLQEGIMKARMLPVSHVFNKFPRMARDIAKSQGKDIQLSFEGEDTELDKTVIDELGEPLLHIIRNAIDHGIETAEERIRKGKPRVGKLLLSASQESNYIIIRVADDGRGIDLERIRETGIEKGLIKAEDTVSREDIFSLIFAAGFTTKEKASDVSGRGIGLDVVNRTILKLNGHVIVDSFPEKGTTFTIKLPLSLAIIPALIAETNGEIYAIPMSAVDESIKVREEDIHIINNHEVIRFREKILPVIRLNEFFGLNRERRKKFYLVIVGKAEKRIAVAVDRLIRQQEIVIKPLDDTFGKSYGISGATILGDGRIVLIVDVLAFWNKGQKDAGYTMQDTR